METVTEPKRRNAARTRERILTAAFEAFADRGYANTGIRDVAERAEVASSLVLKHFGSKANLLHDALIFGIFKESMFPRDKRRFGERMARMMVDAGQSNVTTLMVLAVADTESREVARRVIKRHVLEPLAEWLGPPHAAARAVTLYGIMSGFAIQMRMLDKGRLPAPSVKWLARTMQDVVDEV